LKTRPILNEVDGATLRIKKIGFLPKTPRAAPEGIFLNKTGHRKMYNNGYSFDICFTLENDIS